MGFDLAMLSHVEIIITYKTYNTKSMTLAHILLTNIQINIIQIYSKRKWLFLSLKRTPAVAQY